LCLAQLPLRTMPAIHSRTSATGNLRGAKKVHECAIAVS
jgi:hypothetical protein